MDDPELDDLIGLVPPLLGALEALGFVARHANPGDIGAVLAPIGAPDAAVAEALPRLQAWPERLDFARGRLEAAGEAVIRAFEGLRAATTGDGRQLFRALGQAWRAQEALYPLAGDLPPVNRFFLDPAMRPDEALQARLAEAGTSDLTGLFHGGGEPGARGGFSAYAPETYDAGRAWPLVMALHGGAGNGRGFLWSWLREARGRGAIVITPTAIGETWALSGPDVDTPNLMAILDWARGLWNIDASRLLLAGMSDGGTFSYVSGLTPDSPFTHLAPTSAAFHPFLAEMADSERLTGLPIHITHGVRDWMFPVEMARDAHDALSVAGAAVTYREVADLGHTYPRELNPELLDWLRATARPG